MAVVCHGTCDRYIKANYKMEKQTGYCKNCNYGFYIKDVERHRCPCCHNVLRTHKRTGLKIIDEKMRM